MVAFVSRTLAGTCLAAIAFVAAPVAAAPMIIPINADLTASPYNVTFGDNLFTFSSTGDLFGPLAVQTGGSAQISSFGGFLGLPVTPSASFTNRNAVQYGPGVFGSYASFANTTQVGGIGDAYLGLKAVIGSLTYYGYSYTTNATLNLIAFEMTPNTVITAPNLAVTTPPVTSAVPEPATWAMFLMGFGLAGGALRARRVRVIA